MEPINLLIKPASSLCNLRCKYCFYFDVAACRETKSYGIMKTELLEIIVKKHFPKLTAIVLLLFRAESLHLQDWIFTKSLSSFKKNITIKILIYIIPFRQTDIFSMKNGQLFSQRITFLWEFHLTVIRIHTTSTELILKTKAHLLK